MKLNLGAGLDVRAGYLNLDSRSLPGIDLIWNLDRHPWPLPEGTFDEVLALDVFEHLGDVVAAMDACWRLLVPGGVLIVRGPTPESPNLWADVTHRRAFVESSFDHFDPATEMGQKYAYGAHQWTVLSVERGPNEVTFVLQPIKRDVSVLPQEVST